MAAEAAPPLSFDAQQHQEEYIDYSEDDAAGPTVAAKGSNHSSFSANAHFAADVTENAEPSLETDDQTVDVRVAAETLLEASDAQPEGSGQEPVGTGSSEDAALINQIPEEAEDMSFNENEISWEDGLNESQAADHNDDGAEFEKGDWQLVDEGTHLADNEPEIVDSAPEDEEPTSHESDKMLDGATDNTDVPDASAQETSEALVNSSYEEQVLDNQGAEADDSHEIDYFEDGIPTADTSAEAAEAQAAGHAPDLENLSNAHSDKNAEDRAMGEDPDSPSQHDAENQVVAIDDDIDDAADMQDHNGQENDAQDHAEAGDDESTHEQMEYEDEMLADAQSLASVDTPSNEDPEIPVITVSYKGVEYPFFYNSPDSEGKECFFDDLSLLHCKMEGVLAGFRRELANELGPFDELVFQIDELGLEFAESSQPETFSDITLGQIFSVFDSLVKNQDPDASKPLYAMLLTRPNCKKRWLSLVDDAYNGKGLDEVSYYFASQAHSEVAEPEILDDEPGMVGEEDNADACTWPKSPGESEHSDHLETESQLEQYEPNEDDVGIAVEDDAVAQDTADEDTLQAELTVVEDLDAEATMVDTDIPLIDDLAAAADLDIIQGSSMMEDQETQTSGDNAPETDATNPLVDWDTEEVDLLNAIEVNEHFANDADGTAIVDQTIEGTDVSSAKKVTPNTSATSTLNGDEVTQVTQDNNELDLNADIAEYEQAGTNPEGQKDELAEIDWREFPGQGDDDVAESPSVFGKRPRSDVDDMLDDEAEKDVKRRRS